LNPCVFFPLFPAAGFVAVVVIRGIGEGTRGGNPGGVIASGAGGFGVIERGTGALV
jgi:hypothetical protein